MHNIDMVILCGGLGTRLRPIIGERQKTVAEIGTKPFLALLIDYTRRFGLTRFILCTGFSGHEVRNMVHKYYGDEKDLSFVFSEEKTPLGTGGALKKAMPLVASDPFLVVNGDTFMDLDFPSFLSFHQDSGSLLSIALTKSAREDGGNVQMDPRFCITSFEEKQKKDSLCYINAGAYAMSKKILTLLPSQEKFSLEHDLFPKATESGKCFGYVHKGKMFDIGTPERFAGAPEFLKDHLL